MHASPLPSAEEQHREEQGLLMSLKLVFELGFIIAIPVVLLGFGGAYADKAWETSPLFLLLGMASAALLSGIAIFRKVRSIQRTEFGNKSQP